MTNMSLSLVFTIFYFDLMSLYWTKDIVLIIKIVLGFLLLDVVKERR